jgi:nitrate reductase alpha subunit
VFNVNGAIAARGGQPARDAGHGDDVPRPGKIINVPGSEITGTRGGIHNSVTRIVLKPTHMIGGYAQLAYGFNYYGTCGTNRDEFVIVRKMNKVDWLDGANVQEHRMKIRAQIGMVLNLDKCIGCHTCSVTCKNVWTSREGVEYAWFNNVETKPGIGYPKEWENQDKWNGGWVRTRGKLVPRAAALAHAGQDLRQPDLPQIDDYYEPFDFDYSTCTRAKDKHQPTARPRSLITGERMEKIEWGPNWEEILGGEFSKRARTTTSKVQKEIYGAFENTFMMYLPRLCEHCLNPACVAACPSGSIYKREEDGIVLIDQDKCRGWRMCVSAARTRRSTTTGRAARPRSASSATRASRRASRPCARKPAWAASATWACCCTTPTASPRPPRWPPRRTCTRRSWTSSSTRTIRR